MEAARWSAAVDNGSGRGAGNHGRHSDYSILKAMQILLLGGGTSPERQVSLRSAAAVRTALENLGHEVTFIDPRDTSQQQITQAARQAEAVFPILHGEGGEDGNLQLLLDSVGTPYFGSTAEACAQTFDKVTFKRLLDAAGIATPKSAVLDATTIQGAPITGWPFVLKPIQGGSSIDTFIVRQPPGPYDRMEKALSRYGTMLAEELIDGREITVGILGDEPLPVIEIIPPTGAEFDYENKYNGATQELCPPRNVNQALQRQAQQLALRVHKLMGCRHVSRTDILIGPDEQLYVIDTNTIPGMTTQSLLPKAAAAAGYDWPRLVDRFVQLTAS